MRFDDYFKLFSILPDFWERLKECGKPVCIYGTGDACERILEQFRLRGISCAGIFASNDFIRGEREFHGYTVGSLSALEERFGDIAVCCAFGSQLPDVMAYIEKLAERHELVFPDLPVAGDEFFTRKGILQRRNELESVYEMLADDVSRNVLRNVLLFKLTGDIKLLKHTFSEADETLELISPQPGDNYADLGAYNGDTIESFIRICPEHGQIYAFEPDPRSFRKCVNKHIDLGGITFINACAWSRDCMLRFSQCAGRQSQIADSGKLTAARSLDSVLSGQRCDIIKLDVEGAESEALNGAAETIKRCRPRLAVSAYHRPYDLITLPLQLCEYGSFSFYMRQPPYYPTWDTCVIALPD